MKSFRFVHAADLHLDSPFKGLSKLPDHIKSVVRESTLSAFDSLVSLCIEQQADFLLIAGDVYDEHDRSLRAQLRFQQGTTKLAQKGIHTFVVHGNHDPVDGYRATLRWPETVHFFPSDRVLAMPFEKNGKEVARIFGRSFPTRAVSENYALGFRNEGLSSFSIGLLHTNVDGNAGHDNYAPCTTQELLSSGLNYWALGHVHTRSQRHAGNTHINYPGNIQGRSVRETGMRGCYVVDVDDDKNVSIVFAETHSVRWEQVAVDIATFRHEQDLFDALENVKAHIRQIAEGKPVLLRITLEGRGILHKLLSDEKKKEMIEEMLVDGEEHRDDFIWVESLLINTRHEISRDKLMSEEHILSDLLRYSEQMNTPEALTALREEALNALLSNSKLSRYLTDVNDEELLQWKKEAEELAIAYLASDRGEDDET